MDERYSRSRLPTNSRNYIEFHLPSHIPCLASFTKPPCISVVSYCHYRQKSIRSASRYFSVQVSVETMAFPVNSSHITFDGSSHFNSTVLDEFAYRVFPNGTLSNETSCFLIFAPYRPVLLPNGTFINSTSCDTPIDPVEVRGALGITVAVLFALSIVLCCVNLSKHGRTHLDVDKRWTLVSRRWPWYWALLSAGLGCVSGFMAIDVDRDYVQGSAIILQSVFYYCMLPTTMAAVWEMTRHWYTFHLLSVSPDKC